MLRHRRTLTVFGTGQISGERHCGRRQQPSVLAGVNSARGRGAAVEDPSHRVVHGITGFAAAQELQMHVGRQPVRVNGAAGGRQALRDELPAVCPLSVGTAARPDPDVFGATLLQLKQPEQRAHRGSAEPVATVPDSVSTTTSSSVSPKHSIKTSAVSSPKAGAATACG